MKNIIWVIIVLLLIGGGYYLYTGKKVSTPTDPVVVSKYISSAVYACDASKNIAVDYFDTGVPVSVPAGQPPVPTGSVNIKLSDRGAPISLKQTISGSGVRYANADESIVMWNKGRTVMFTENNVETFANCMQIAAETNNMTQVYKNNTFAYTLRYPNGYTVNESYKYEAMGPGKTILGTKFTIPASMATGTNLSTDSYISVEHIDNNKPCTASLFTDNAASTSTVTQNGNTYSVATSADAGAGNRYEETIYAIPGSAPCVAIRYFVHYSAIENYPKGKVTEFNKVSLINQFDAIRLTLMSAK